MRAAGILILCLSLASLGMSRAEEPPSIPAPAVGPAFNAEGFHWSAVKGVQGALRVFPSPMDPGTVFVWTRSGLLASKDGGTIFSARPAAELGEITALLIDPARPFTLYAGTNTKGVFLSRDEGVSWHALGGTDAGLASLQIHSLSFGAEDSSYTTLFATHSMAKGGISMSIDGGKTWRVFAREYGVDDMLILQGNTIFFGGTHPPGGEEIGFYRLDAMRGSFRVSVNPPTVLAKSLFTDRIWLGTSDAGTKFSDDFGVTKFDAEAPGKNVQSLTTVFASPTSEAVIAYEPAGEGVVVSSSDFKTWTKINDGLYVGEWVTEGARMAASKNGGVLFACINGKLYRGSRTGKLGLSNLKADPAAVVTGDGPVKFSCRAAKGTRIAIDLTPVGGPASVAMQVEGAVGPDGPVSTYAAQFDRIPDGVAARGCVALKITAVAGGVSETGLALLTVSHAVKNLVLWDGEEHDFLAPRGNTVKIARCTDKPNSGGAHLRVQVTGAGEAGMIWNKDSAIDFRYHKYLSFFICSESNGGTDLKIGLRDDGHPISREDGRRSHEVPLSKYVPVIDATYRLVTIPLADLMLGSAISPDCVLEIIFSAPDGSPPRIFNVDDITLIAQRGPFLMGPDLAAAPDGSGMRLGVRALDTGDAKAEHVKASIGEKTMELHDDGDGRYSTVIPFSAGIRGTQAVRLSASDSALSTETAFSAFFPPRAPGKIPSAQKEIKLDGNTAQFEAAPPFTAGENDLSLNARVLRGADKLYVSVEVTDAQYTAKELSRDLNASKIAETPSVELLILSPSKSKQQDQKNNERRIVFAFGGKQAVALSRNGNERLPVFGRKTEKGYLVQAEISYNALHRGGDACDFNVGVITRIEWRLKGANGKYVYWATPSTESSTPSEKWGLAAFSK